jgi:hypothetical protein
MAARWPASMAASKMSRAAWRSFSIPTIRRPPIVTAKSVTAARSVIGKM